MNEDEKRDHEALHVRMTNAITDEMLAEFDAIDALAVESGIDVLDPYQSQNIPEGK